MDHWVYALEEAAMVVGYLWLAERDNQGRRVIWIYEESAMWMGKDIE